ncbi:Hypothetical_protein [Hexamita inflata]|uniref:Hypothetical_protein n=1 Tax=Hexamita inflata TaxID=28002 RepID=A0AA86UDA4_9EUKA|nr:Hypothetical protein HINF_LOCUS41280 [Hexamita inflata]
MQYLENMVLQVSASITKELDEFVSLAQKHITDIAALTMVAGMKLIINNLLLFSLTIKSSIIELTIIAKVIKKFINEVNKPRRLGATNSSNNIGTVVTTIDEHNPFNILTVAKQHQ